MLGHPSTLQYLNTESLKLKTSGSLPKVTPGELHPKGIKFWPKPLFDSWENSEIII